MYDGDSSADWLRSDTGRVSLHNLLFSIALRLLLIVTVTIRYGQIINKHVMLK